MGRLFGTNGVRGIFGKDFTLDMVYHLTLAMAEYFGEGPILVGRDGRHTSDMVSKVVCSTLNYAGLDTADAGLVPTPCLEYSVKSLDYTGGIMVTASHNPPEYNGLKPVASDGVEISRSDECIIEENYFNPTNKRRGPKFGSCTREDRAISTYVGGIQSHVDAQTIRKKRYTVVLDMGNGAQAVTAPLLCKSLNCNVVAIHDTIHGDFPGRGSEPTPENLQNLSDTVKKNNADIGVAFDGDGDRSIICDENGSILTGDRSALFLLNYILKKQPNSTIITCLNSAHTVDRLAEQYDSNVIRTKVGSVEVSRRMVDVGAPVGFEENGGFMFGHHHQVRDGLMTLALALSALASTDNTISESVFKLPSSFTTKDKIHCKPEQSARILDKLYDMHPDADRTDGIKITLGTSTWVMVRPSGTEPLVRIYAEAPSLMELDQLVSKYLNIIKS
ncbi:MAG: phosphoglucosamine mutase [Cenarchaeum sp. SB0665_bin_23]|nr:phosphoglucosamine mutase [Cenarchaeum sp. SB0667_bin_13]MXY60666.1 phosphoglucosamine mutase [Cenarchaeum sp. SB0665_bin_23]MYB47186.1 phosphoglucosamine mutase [Cenarchaeum sp. SB0662_bin_33]MYC79983.1 phosphoglucosamine mutase [Cenarchaeum sp. SB0661_bin_35]MYI51890.1 phosphoglucosamine mutase [Cenarchaeum sp. SB0673_bin_9]